ncbi:MAG: SdrD B-like domain-containing protein, partial [Lewinella sp.]
TYLWSNGTTGNAIENITAGAYSVTVTDQNGCTNVTASILLNELPELTCEVVVDQQSTDGTNGVLSVNVDGGTQPYTYLWSNNATTPTISDLAAGTYSVTVTDFSGCTTECTGTLRALAGLGDFVWEDFNVNGQQDDGEPGISDYPVYLKNAAGVIIDSTRTDMDGFYSFMGLEPGTYSVLFIEAPGGIRTIANAGNDASDSDGDPAMNGMTQQYTLSPGEFNMTVDAGFFAEPGGAIADPCNCLDNNTTDFDGQFTEILEVTASPGQTWTILSNSNMFFLDSPDPPLAPTPVPVGTVIPQTEVRDGNVAIYSFEFLLIDSFEYTTVLTNGAYTLEIGNQCFYPEIRFVELPPEQLCVFDDVFSLDGLGRINGENLPGTTTFTINGVPVTEIDPSALPLGENVIEASFIPTDEDECIPSAERTIVIIDDCPAKIGDFVWQDTNGNGQQDPGEPGIEGVKAIVTSQDGTYMDMAFTDETGMYMFFVPPGTYKVTFEAPDGFLPTTGDSGDDETDSDIMGGMMMTGFYTVGPDEMDLTIDAGFIVPCISNIINPGTIASSQEVCGPGNVPQPFIEIAPATGGEGEIQYLWMFNVEDPNQDITFWQALPNSNSPNYAPGPVYQTTYFTRCVRRDNCNYLESNVLTVDVGDDAVAEVSGPNVVCVGEEAIFQAVNPGNGASISWNFTGSSSVESATTPTVATTWATFGSFSATLTVTRNGCTSTQVFNVAVVNNPNRCGGNLRADGSVNNLQAREVAIEWQVPFDGTDYEFELQRSVDARNFLPIADVSVPAFVSGNDMAMFRQNDVSPLAGRTFYRVRMIDPVYGDMMSNVVELQLAGLTSSLGRIFPNPAREGMIHVEMTEEANNAGDVSIQLIDVRGNAVGPRTFLQPGTGVINLPSNGVPAGVYFVRMGVGDQTETHRVIIN